MAAEQSNHRRGISGVVSALLIPRKVTLPALAGMGAVVGQLLWVYIDSVKILAWIAGMATPFCMMCTTAVWTMRDRMDEAVDVDQMSAKEFRAFSAMSSEQRARSTTWAAVAGLATLLASTPAISKELADSVWQWMVIGCGISVGTAVYSYLLADFWEKQIRASRHKQKLDAKLRQEINALQREISGGSTRDIGPGWSEGNFPVRPHH